jgi:hypothetical protein
MAGTLRSKKRISLLLKIQNGEAPVYYRSIEYNKLVLQTIQKTTAISQHQNQAADSTRHGKSGLTIP